ncbi:MAG: AsmA family protein [Magnetococcales bacterium]|nr:AsmA family protein [Magnetococcales bacterium]
MGKAIKAFIYLVLGVVILVGGLFAAVALLVNPNDYKGEIVNLVKEKTGRDLTITQDMSLTFFPWVGVELGGLVLSNAKGFGSDPFMGVDSVRVRVKLMPLFKSRLEADSILVKGLRLNLAKNAKGVSNWDDLTASPDTDKPSSPTSESPVGSDHPSTVVLSVGGVNIENAALRWQDAQAGVDYALEKINFSTGPLTPETPFDMKLAFGLSSNEPALGATIELSGRATLDLSAQRYQFSSAVLAVKAQGAAIPEGKTEMRMGFDALADLSQESLSVEGLKLAAMGMDLSGKIVGSSIVSKPHFKADLSLAEFNLKKLLSQLAGEPVQTLDPKAMSRVSSQIALTAGLEEARVTQLTVHLDETTLKGSGSVSHFSNPVIGFNLTLDTLDVDRYLPPQPSSGEGQKGDIQAKSKAKKGGANQGESLKSLRGLNLDGTFKAGKLKVANASLTDLTVGVKANEGIIKVQPLSAHLYQGLFDGNVKMDARRDLPVVWVNYDLKNLQAGPLLKDVTGADRLSGTARSTANISTRGFEPDTIKANLNGTADFFFENGALNGVNVARMIRNAFNMLKGIPPEPEGTAQKTDFAELSGSVNINQGVVENQDLSMKSPLLRITGKGQVDLPGNQINYEAKAAVVGTLKGQDGQSIDELKNIVVPIKVTGSLDEPKPALDVGAVLRENLKGQAKEKLKEQISEKLKGRGLGGAEGLLKNILPF